MLRSLVSSLFLLALMSFPHGSIVFAEKQASVQIPSEYQQLYTNLKGSLDQYDAYLSSHSTRMSSPVVFGAELLPANSNRGSDLLTQFTKCSICGDSRLDEKP